MGGVGEGGRQIRKWMNNGPKNNGPKTTDARKSVTACCMWPITLVDRVGLVVVPTISFHNLATEKHS